MVVDRIERHDVFNAVMLAFVLLLLGFGILSAANSFGSTVDEGIVESTKEEDALESEAAGPLASGGEDPVAETEDPVEEETNDLTDPRPAGEVTLRVGNGARRPGVAGAGTALVEAAGYPTLAPKNGPTMDDSVVYFASGYAADAAAVADVLGLEASQIEPMPDDPGVEIEGAHIIAILGVESDF